MKARIALPTVAAIAVAFLSLALTSGTAGASGMKADFDAIKKLEGNWVRVDENGKPENRVFSSYTLTAGGSAVLEKIFVGSDKEMVTLYHPDGADLVLTHYCVEGNQPHMKAVADAGPGKLVFRCAGASNLKSENERHMHQGTITWIGQDSIRSEWLMYENGKNSYTASFDLIRERR